MSASLPPTHEEGISIHRRETRWQIWLPFALLALLMLILLFVLVLPQDVNTRFRAEAVANIFVTVFLICPGILLLFGIYVLMVAGVVGVNRLHDGVLPPLQRLERLSGQARAKVNGWAMRANQSAVHLGAVLAPLETLFDHLEKFTKESNDDAAKR